jgi:hypothetical protein
MRTEEVNQAEELLMSMVDSKHFMDKIFNIIQNNNLEGTSIIIQHGSKPLHPLF